jgi:uncharacterized cupin superfamily protein
MPSKDPVVGRSIVTDDDLPSAPIDPSWIHGGRPTTRARSLVFPTGATISATIWETTTGEFDWHYPVDELIQILAGEVEIRPPTGPAYTLGPGDLVFFPAGQVVRWNVREYVKKVAINNVRLSPWRRLAHRVPFAVQLVHRLRTIRGGS